MKICLVCSGYPPDNGGGIGTYTENLANALYEIGNDVTVISKSENDYSHYENTGNIKVIRARVKYIPILERLVPGISWSIQLNSILREIQKKDSSFDVIEFPNWEAPGIVYQLLNRTSTVVVRVHTPYFETLQLDKGIQRSFSDKVICAIEKLSCLKAHSLVSSTEAHAKMICDEYNIAINKFAIVPLGLKDCFVAEEKNSKYIKDNKFKIIYLSRLENRKGTLLLIDALPILLNGKPDLIIDIIGQDRPHAPGGIYFKEYFKKHFNEYSAQVKFHGKLETSLCHDFLYKADLFVVPSLYESFGLIFAEAMMFGLPSISTRGGGIPEVVLDESTGLLLNEISSLELANKIFYFYNNRDKLHVMSFNARERYIDKFSSITMAKNTISNYELAKTSKSKLADN
ncbi:MAG: glycosyltransferase family 4 protein [Paraglaciecola sp.]|uniref:glycosyltransferase family 4 protein n=1 Tax=Paraglaciecola sp. TaxID=1920173 RepID=UPI00273DAF75|nr:glycosyltransferase family 4 protein [Paraglaciecola sp.]MDP5030743.1 glycosyltransferase family 4 protein [Paraglaciecola sp.]MDP5132307.1 glycosyltransferase family 4 protein [Paraglaciecola sp.]